MQILLVIEQRWREDDICYEGRRAENQTRKYAGHEKRNAVALDHHPMDPRKVVNPKVARQKTLQKQSHRAVERISDLGHASVHKETYYRI